MYITEVEPRKHLNHFTIDNEWLDHLRVNKMETRKIGVNH